MSDNDHNAILHANLDRVFNERVAARRIVAIRELYREDAELHESGHSAQGHEAISQAVTDLLAHLPPNFGFYCDQASTEPSWRWPTAVERRALGRPRRSHRH